MGSAQGLVAAKITPELPGLISALAEGGAYNFNRTGGYTDSKALISDVEEIINPKNNNNLPITQIKLIAGLGEVESAIDKGFQAKELYEGVKSISDVLTELKNNAADAFVYAKASQKQAKIAIDAIDDLASSIENNDSFFASIKQADGILADIWLKKEISPDKLVGFGEELATVVYETLKKNRDNIKNVNEFIDTGKKLFGSLEAVYYGAVEVRNQTTELLKIGISEDLDISQPDKIKLNIQKAVIDHLKESGKEGVLFNQMVLMPSPKEKTLIFFGSNYELKLVPYQSVY